MKILVRRGGNLRKDDAEDEDPAQAGISPLIREEEEVQMVFVDGMGDSTDFERIESGAKYGKRN